MDVTLWHKFTQHSDLREELLDTGDAELIEVGVPPPRLRPLSDWSVGLSQRCVLGGRA